MISGKSGLFHKLGDYAVIRDGNRDGRKMNYQKHFVLLLLGGCLSVIAGEPPMERQAPPPVAEEAVIFVVDHSGGPGKVPGNPDGSRIAPQKAGGRSSLRQFRVLRIAGKGILSPSRKSFATEIAWNRDNPVVQFLMCSSPWAARGTTTAKRITATEQVGFSSLGNFKFG